MLGRKCEAMLAVDRNKAKEFGKEGRDELKGKRDKRNLYLKVCTNICSHIHGK